MALTEYCTVALILEKESNSLNKAFQQLSVINVQIDKDPWVGIIWDGKKIINRVSRPLIRDLLLYMTCSRLLEGRKDKFYEDYSTAANISVEKAKERLISFQDKGDI